MKSGASQKPMQEISPLGGEAPEALISKLLEERCSLLEERASLVEHQHKLEEENAWLQEQVRILKATLFQRKSEKRHLEEDGDDIQQLLLFDAPQETVMDADPDDDDTTSVNVQGHTRRKRGRKPLPEDLPRVDIIHDLPEDEKICACGCPLTFIGEDVTERLDIVPAKIQVHRHVRYKYACKGCEGIESGDVGAVKTASLPPQIIPQGIVSAGLLAYIAVAKFADAVPLYRQEKQFQRIGLDISRGTLSQWMILVARGCQRILELLMDEIRSGPVINMDETPVQVLKEPGRANTTKSYMWVCRGGPPGCPGIVFRHEPTRSEEVPKRILKDYRGFVQTDGCKSYDWIEKEEGIRHLGCWAHVRRKFMKVVKGTKGKNKTGVAKEVLDLIGRFYQCEKAWADLAPEDRKLQRQEHAPPLLNAIKAILEQRVKTTPPKSLLGIAVNYAWNQWPLLTVYLEDGYLRMDNNLAENAIRPFVVGRKNWLFSGSPVGANASALIYSFIETAKANNLEPYAYLKVLFTKIPMAKTDDEIKALLPQYIDPKSVSQVE